MEVLSPVGRFPLRLGWPRIADRRLTLPATMGAWRSEVRIGSEDAPLVGAAVGGLALAYWLGRSARRGR